VTEHRALDVSALPTFAFGHRSPMWWALIGMIAIESTMFGLLIAAYFYLVWREPNWPPGVAPPALLWGTITTALLVVSLVPNALAKRAGEELDLSGVRLWMVVSAAVAVVIVAIRAMEFVYLNVWWDSNAYGSIVWMLLGMHTAHLLTDLYDTIVLAVLMFTGPIEGKRYVDVSENGVYWYFVVVSWLPVYAILYLAARVL
jgi:heme/copper-type cytochrome/quinol oxidase subunit 3